MARFGFGIVGTGMIAGVIADALTGSTRAKLTAVSSRKLENARKFVSNRPGVEAVQGVEALLAHDDVDAVYVACPTCAKEPIALAAIAAGKHVLVDKPFASQASLLKIVQAAQARGVVFMDATHFVHHPRTAAVQAALLQKIGRPRSLHTAFYFPFSDRNNIRFDPRQEPMTGLGDMAWYSMRAIVEYLCPTGPITKATTVVERDAETSGIIHAVGLVAFGSGEVSTFDVGYTAGTLLMDLQLIGDKGVIEKDDFVLDWVNSFAFKNPDIQLGYRHRSGMATRKDAKFVPTPAAVAQEVAMIDDFAELAKTKDAAIQAKYVNASLRTQEYLDRIWQAANQ